MRTVPSALWAELTSESPRPVGVVEITLTDSTVLRYARQSLTWGGNAYARGLVRTSDVQEEMAYRIHDFTATISNVTNLLRSYLEPTDLLTGGRLTYRLLFRDSGGSLLTDSLVLFVGRIEPPRKVSEREFDLKAVTLDEGAGIDIPKRRTTNRCPWAYANGGAFDGGGECAYQSTTTTTASDGGSATTSVPVAERINLANGQRIRVGSASATLTTIQSGGGVSGAGTITVSPAVTFANGAAVRLADCNREGGDCSTRAQLYRFGGFLGVANAAKAAANLAESRGIVAYWVLADDLQAAGFDSLSDALRVSSSADPMQAVPILYGRRRIQPRLMEFALAHASGHFDKASHYLISEGEIDSIYTWWLDGKKRGANYVSGGYLRNGIRYRDGDVGIDAASGYDPNATTLAQNIDFFTKTATAYSRCAYVTFVEVETAQSAQVNDLRLDAKGIKCQRYTTGGAADGARAYSANPLWHIVDLLTSSRYGGGLATTDLDFAVTRPEADYCDVSVTSTEAATTISTGVTSATQTVENTDGFLPGMTVAVNGVDKTLLDVVDDRTLLFSTSFATTTGHTVVQKTPRFQAGLYVDGRQALNTWTKRLLAACRGYRTFDAGKIQLRVERATVTERLTDGGFETWTSATNLTSWTEGVSAGNTVNRESSVIDAGTYSARLDRTASGNLSLSSFQFGLEANRWHRFKIRYRGSSGSLTNSVRLKVVNVTRSTYCAQDGVTWGGASNVVITATPTTSFQTFEITFRPESAATDSDVYRIEIFYVDGSPNGSLYFDAASVRGPYAGDFRESGYVNAMGTLADGFGTAAMSSFRWSLDRKDRETNRVACRFVNESNQQGADEAIADDFTHQATNPLKVKTIDGSAVLDRDQAVRLAKHALGKARTLGTGCEFKAGPAALPVQPGDVILVTHSLPNWSVNEQRVTEVSIGGEGGDGADLVTIKTEDYQETLYETVDVGPPQRKNVRPTRPTISTVLTKLSARAHRLTWAPTDGIYGFRRYEIHKGTSAAFTPTSSTLVGETGGTSFTYHAEASEIGTTLYWQVVAITDTEPIVSSEVNGTVLHNVSEDVDPTMMENSRPENHVWDGDFSDTANWSKTGTITETTRDSSDNAASTEPNSAGSPTNAYTSNDSRATLTSTWVEGTTTLTLGGHKWGGFGAAATVAGKFKIEWMRIAGTFLGTAKAYYTLDDTAGTPTWVEFATHLTGTSDAVAYSPVLSGVDRSKLEVKVIVTANSGAGADKTLTMEIDHVGFVEQTSTAPYATIESDRATLVGDGSSYAEVYRDWPGQTPSTSAKVYAAEGEKLWTRILCKRAGAALAHDVEVVLYDSLAGVTHTLLTIAAADVLTTNQEFSGVYTVPAGGINGYHTVRVRTKATAGCVVDQLAVGFGEFVYAWAPHVGEMVNGKFGDRSVGRRTGFTRGAWSGVRKGQLA